MKNTFLQKLQTEKAKLYWQVFGLCFLFCALMQLPMVIADLQKGSYLVYLADYTNQMMPYQMHAGDFLRTGGSYSWATDMGSGFVNSYAYLVLGSPFFWLTALLPARAIPYMMPVFTCLKYAVAGGGAFLWACRRCRNPRWAMVAGALYAFCGYNAYSLIYFFFVDAVALFPYLLAALDAAVLDGKRGRFLGMVALCMLTNYFLFVGAVVFLILYFVCMVWGKEYQLRLPLFLRLAFESLCGCGLGCLLFLPSMLYLLGYPRATAVRNGLDLLLYPSATQYLQLFFSAFQVPDVPNSTSVYGGVTSIWSNMTLYLPLAGVTGGLALYRRNQKHPFSRLLFVCVVFAFVPVLNSSFAAFNSTYYARWFFMPVLVLAGAAAIMLEQETEQPEGTAAFLPGTARFVLLCTVAFGVLGLLPTKNTEGVWRIGVEEMPLKYWVLLALSAGGAALFYYLVTHRDDDKAKYCETVLTAVLAVGVVAGGAHCLLSKSSAEYQSDLKAKTYDSVAAVQAFLPDEQNYRAEAYSQSVFNLGLWFDKSILQAYNSTVAQGIPSFYTGLGMSREVTSDPPAQIYALRALLGVKYNLVPLTKEEDWLKECNPPDSGQTDADAVVNFYAGESTISYNPVPLKEWNKIGEAGSYAVYENKNFVPLGVPYDFYVTEEQMEDTRGNLRSNLMLKALELTEEQAARYADLLSPLPAEECENLDYSAYEADCAKNKAAALTSFTMTNTGFTAVADLTAPKMVLFAVPYEDGFTATANGEPLTIEQVDGGLMAVVLPAGHTDVVFTYHTPGLKVSMTITAVSTLLAAAYLLLSRRKAPQPTNA